MSISLPPAEQVIKGVVVKEVVEDPREADVEKLVEAVQEELGHKPYGNSYERVAMFWSNYLGIEITWNQAKVMMVLYEASELLDKE